MSRSPRIALALLALTIACSDDDDTSSPDTGAGGMAGDSGAGLADASVGPDAAGQDAGDASASDAKGGSDSAAADAPSTDGGTGDASGSDAAMPSAAVLRGQYLANVVLGCVGCHTPSGMMGLDQTKRFSGVECFTDTMPPRENGMGCLHSANLTPDDDTGIGKLSDAQLKELITAGKRPQTGDYLFSNMPYHQFANLNAADLDGLVAYLRSLPPINHRIPANEAPFDTRPTTPEWAAVPLAAVPAGDNANGKYLATLMCLNCHTPEKAGATPRTFDAAKAFQGGRMFGPFMTMPVTSANLTPHDTGLKEWTAADIVKAIKMGLDNKGGKICSPMRPAPMLTDADANDIASYLLSIPAVDSPRAANCVAP